MKRWVLLAATWVLSSCALWGPSRVQDLIVEGNDRRQVSESRILIKELAVEKDLDRDRIRENAIYILSLLFDRHAQKEKNPERVLEAHVVIKEDSFLKGIDTRNSVAVEIVFMEPGGEKPVAKMLFSEESEDSISSYRYLYSVLSAAVAMLY